jgi:hypothetical protein
MGARTARAATRILALGALVSGTLALAGMAPAGAALPPVATTATTPAPHPELMRRITSVQTPRGSAASSSSAPMQYHGGTGQYGVAVTTGAPRVYLVFWGSQWGTQSLDAQGYATFSHDPSNEAVVLQRLYAGLGTDGETWSQVLAQYCQSGALSYLATSCQGLAHPRFVGLPSGGALAGVWYDAAQALTTRRATCTGGGLHRCRIGPSATQLSAEAMRAERHFGLVRWGLARDAQIVIASPTGTFPDGFDRWVQGYNTDFCAWHDYTGSAAYRVPWSSMGMLPDIAFTNLPYLTDAGTSCGAYALGGPRDGISIVASHEYAETLTDQFPESTTGGWFNDVSGAEVGDACAWQPDGAGLVRLGTGRLPLSSVWSNAAGRCVLSTP